VPTAGKAGADGRGCRGGRRAACRRAGAGLALPGAAYYSPRGVVALGGEGRAGDGAVPRPAWRGVPPEVEAQLRHLERELARARRSRRVLLDLLWRLDREWRDRLARLEAENRRLWAARRLRSP
jgi:hypothetical protein